MRGFKTKDNSREQYDFHIGRKSSESNYFYFKLTLKALLKKRIVKPTNRILDSKD